MYWNIFNLPLAFTAGIIAAFNPCGVVLLPSYITYIFIQSNNQKNNTPGLIFFGFKIGISMTAGFITIFIITGIIISYLGTFFTRYTHWISILIGVAFFITGLLLLLNPEKINNSLNFNHLGKKFQQYNGFNFFIYGIGYALVSLACTLPIFMMAVLTNFITGDLLQGVLGFILYGLGMGLVVTTISILSLFARKFIQKVINNIIPHINKISAILIMLTGIYLIYYWFLGPGQI